MCSENMAKNYQKCCQIVKITILLHEIDTDEKDDSIRFWTKSRNTTTSVQAQGKKSQKIQTVSQILN